MVTHDPTAAATADRVLFIVDGLIAAELPKAPPEKVAHTLSSLEVAA